MGKGLALAKLFEEAEDARDAARHVGAISSMYSTEYTGIHEPAKRAEENAKYFERKLREESGRDD